MNKKAAILTVTTLCLLLVGCGQQSNQSTTKTSSSSSSLLVAKSDVKINSDNLTPQAAVSLITTYCGLKYGGDWAETAKAAQQVGLVVKLYPASDYKLTDEGQGVAYQVAAGSKARGTVYTVNGDRVNIYQHVNRNQEAKKVATVSKAAMASYVNQKQQGKLVKDLAADAQVIDQRGGTSSRSNGESSTSTEHKYGRLNAINFPSEMQGTWYSSDNDSDQKLVITGNTISYSDDSDSGTTKLFKQDPSFLQDEDNYMSHSVQDATQGWGRGYFFNLDGSRWLNVRGWTQTAGDGSSYAVKTENVDGKAVKVLIEAGGAMNQAEAVYYQSADMAKQQADKKFDDIHYDDD